MPGNRTLRRLSGVVKPRRYRLSQATISTYLTPYNTVTNERIPTGNYYTYKSGNTRIILSPSTLLRLVQTRPPPGGPLTGANFATLRNLLSTTTRMANRPNYPLFMDPYIPSRVVTTKHVALKRKRSP
jgi:hypothetical protein